MFIVANASPKKVPPVSPGWLELPLDVLKYNSVTWFWLVRALNPACDTILAYKVDPFWAVFHVPKSTHCATVVLGRLYVAAAFAKLAVCAVCAVKLAAAVVPTHWPPSTSWYLTLSVKLSLLNHKLPVEYLSTAGAVSPIDTTWPLNAEAVTAFTTSSEPVIVTLFVYPAIKFFLVVLFVPSPTTQIAFASSKLYFPSACWFAPAAIVPAPSACDPWPFAVVPWPSACE